MKRVRKGVYLALGATVIALTGCSSHRQEVYRYPVRTTTDEVVVMQTPPAPQTEVVPVAPGAGYVWVPGYWTWSRSQWLWQPGHYMVVPEGKVAWEPGHWEQRGGSWVWQTGHWR